MNAFARRLDRAEVTRAENTDVRSLILSLRHSPPTPTHTRAELEVLADEPGMVGRIARGWLRLCFTADASRGNSDIDPDTVLAQMAGHLYDKPLDFVLFAYDWGHDRSLRVVTLPESYRLLYDSEHGPDAWACDLLTDVGLAVQGRGFDCTQAVDAVRIAVSSGHGIGKSATTAWLVDWIMATRPNARGVVTANTSPQLESKTWAEIAKWTKRCLFGGWFDITTGKGSMRMTMREHPESWRCDAQTCREENSESFAGLHAADSSPFYVFDEAGAIPAKIWEVGEGGMTDGEPFWFAFGNPTRTSTKFHEAFNGQRYRWSTRHVDSRTCQITNKKQIAEWITDYGIDSDFVKVRVLGQFPSASSLQFIGRDVVNEAQSREVPDQRREAAVIGVDPARFGDDSSVVWTRLGRDARTIPPIRLRGADTMTLAARVAEHINMLRSTGHLVIVNVDGGGVGGGVVDRLRSLGYDINEVQFGSKAMDPTKWANRRAEIWGAMRDWLTGGAIPRDEMLATDLTSVEYGYNNADAILLEKKESMKARGLASPDAADALALTFAVPVPVGASEGAAGGARRERQSYDPYAFLNDNGKRYDPFAVLRL